MNTVLALMLSLAVVYDLRRRRVPDSLAVGGLIAALALRPVIDPASAPGGIGGAVIGTTLVVPLFTTGALGAGDTKLLIAFGAFLGSEALPIALLATAITGGIMSGIVSWRSGVFGPVLQLTKDLVNRCLALGRGGEHAGLSLTVAAISVPRGPSSAAGATLASVVTGAVTR